MKTSQLQDFNWPESKLPYTSILLQHGWVGCTHANEIDNITDIPRAELDGVLQKFYAELEKENGQEYKPESLKVIIASFKQTH